MKKEVIVRLHATFEELVQRDETGNEFWLARDLQKLLGYAKWENFEGVVRRAEQLVRNGAARGSLIKSHKSVPIGSGAVRHIVDYRLDREAVEVLNLLATSFKLNGYFLARNETVLLGLLSKWAAAKGFAAQPQFRLGSHLFDLMIANCILVEFDEPHHSSCRQSQVDKAKQSAAKSAGFKVLRLNLSQDVVDAILGVESLIEDNNGMVAVEADLVVQRAKLTAKAKDFANEITNFNVKRDDLRNDPDITAEDVKNCTDVRGLLAQRGIHTESLPTAEDKKRNERRVQSETKELAAAKRPTAKRRINPSN